MLQQLQFTTNTTCSKKEHCSLSCVKSNQPPRDRAKEATEPCSEGSLTRRSSSSETNAMNAQLSSIHFVQILALPGKTWLLSRAPTRRVVGERIPLVSEFSIFLHKNKEQPSSLPRACGSAGSVLRRKHFPYRQTQKTDIYFPGHSEKGT